MAIGIDELELDIADREAGAIRGKAESFSKIGQMVSGGAKPGLDAAENIVKLDESERMKGEWDKMTANGEQSINALAQELNLDPSEYTKIYQAQRNPQTGQTPPAVTLQVMKMMKDANAQKNKQGELDAFSKGLLSAEGIEEDDKFEKFMNEQQIGVSQMQSQEAKDDARKTLKGIREQREAKAKSSSGAKAVGAGKVVNEFGELLPTVKQDEKLIVDMQKAMVFGSRGGQRVLGTAINKQVAIQDALDTISGIDEGDFIGTQQIGQEVASIIAQVLSVGGQSTESDRKQLFPKSWSGSISNQIQEIKGKPMSAVPKPLMDQLKHMLQREKNFWDSRITDVNKSLSGILGNVFDRTAIIDGKSVRTRRKQQKRFAQWLINQDKSSKSVSSRIKKKRTDIFDLMANEEDRKKFISQALDADLTIRQSQSLEDTIRGVVSGEGNEAVSTKRTASKPKGTRRKATAEDF